MTQLSRGLVVCACLNGASYFSLTDSHGLMDQSRAACWSYIEAKIQKRFIN